MNLDSVTIPIEQRSVGECADLAVRLAAAERRPLVALSAVFALPCVGAAYVVGLQSEYGFATGLVLFWIASPFLGSAIVAGIGPRVFGERFSARRSLDRTGGCFGHLVAAVLVPRLLAVAFGVLFWSIQAQLMWLYIPTVLIIGGHASLVREVILLEGLSGRRLRRRVGDLRQRDPLGLWRRFAIAGGFYLTCVTAAFWIVDAVLEWVLDVPFASSRLAESSGMRDLWYLVAYDPLITSVVIALLWLFYPLARLTMFLGYLDVRIRREGWDIELDVRREAQGLEGGAS